MASAKIYDTWEEKITAIYWSSIIHNSKNPGSHYKSQKKWVNANREKYRSYYRVLEGSDINIKSKRLRAKRFKESAKNLAYEKARREIGKIRVASTGKTYQQVFTELKNKYEQEFKINPPKQRKKNRNRP